MFVSCSWRGPFLYQLPEYSGWGNLARPHATAYAMQEPETLNLLKWVGPKDEQTRDLFCSCVQRLNTNGHVLKTALLSFHYGHDQRSSVYPATTWMRKLLREEVLHHAEPQNPSTPQKPENLKPTLETKCSSLRACIVLEDAQTRPPSKMANNSDKGLGV